MPQIAKFFGIQTAYYKFKGQIENNAETLSALLGEAIRYYKAAHSSAFFSKPDHSRDTDLAKVRDLIKQLDNLDHQLTPSEFEAIKRQKQEIFYHQSRGHRGHSTLEDYVTAAFDVYHAKHIAPQIITDAESNPMIYRQAIRNCLQVAAFRYQQDIYERNKQSKERDHHQASIETFLQAKFKELDTTDDTDLTTFATTDIPNDIAVVLSNHEEFRVYYEEELTKYQNFLGYKSIVDMQVPPGAQHYVTNQYMPDGEVEDVWILLHGWCDSADMWDKFASYKRTEGAALYAYDQKPFGYTKERFERNADGKLQINPQELRQNFEDFVAHIQQMHPGKRLHFAGHSMGGDVLLMSQDIIERLPEGTTVDLYNPAVFNPSVEFTEGLTSVAKQLASASPKNLLRREGENEILEAEVANPRFDSDVATKAKTAASLAKVVDAGMQGLDALCEKQQLSASWTIHAGDFDAAVPKEFIDKIERTKIGKATGEIHVVHHPNEGHDGVKGRNAEYIARGQYSVEQVVPTPQVAVASNPPEPRPEAPTAEEGDSSPLTLD